VVGLVVCRANVLYIVPRSRSARQMRWTQLLLLLPLLPLPCYSPDKTISSLLPDKTISSLPSSHRRSL
jgi:hypothetical protein